MCKKKKKSTLPHKSARQSKKEIKFSLFCFTSDKNKIRLEMIEDIFIYIYLYIFIIYTTVWCQCLWNLHNRKQSIRVSEDGCRNVGRTYSTFSPDKLQTAGQGTFNSLFPKQRNKRIVVLPEFSPTGVRTRNEETKLHPYSSSVD